MKHRTRDYQPSLEAFFPGLRRGHSFGTHLRGLARYADGTLVGKHQPVCTAERCGQKGQPHKDRSGNIKDWEEERGLKLESFYNRRKAAQFVRAYSGDPKDFSFSRDGKSAHLIAA